MLGKFELGLDSGGSTVQYSIIITDGRASESLFSESKTSLNWTRIDVKKNVFDFFLTWFSLNSMMIPCSFRKKVNYFRWGVSEAMVVLHNPKRILILFDSEGGAGSAMSRHSIVLGIASRQHSNLGAHRQVYYIKSNISICKSPDLWLIRVLYIAFRRWDEICMRLDFFSFFFFFLGWREREFLCVGAAVYLIHLFSSSSLSCLLATFTD